MAVEQEIVASHVLPPAWDTQANLPAFSPVRKLSHAQSMHLDRRLTVFVPMRNEAAHVDTLIPELRRALAEGSVDYLVIALDGPADNTKQKLLEALGILGDDARSLEDRNNRFTIGLNERTLLINHPIPEGKGRSFMESIFSLKGWSDHFNFPDSALVCLDADVLHFDQKVILNLAEALWRTDHPMILGRQQEYAPSDREYAEAEPESTCFRAIRASALRPLLDKDFRWSYVLPRSFGMDLALNLLLFGEEAHSESARCAEIVPRAEETVYCAKPFRHSDQDHQDSDRSRVLERFQQLSDSRFNIARVRGPLFEFALGEHLARVRELARDPKWSGLDRLIDNTIGFFQIIAE